MKAIYICGAAFLTLIAGMVYFSGNDKNEDIRKQMSVNLPYELDNSQQEINFSNDSFDKFASQKKEAFNGDKVFFAPPSIQKNLLVKLYKLNAQKQKNQYFSPYLIYLDALMLKNAAQNESAKQLESFFAKELAQTNNLNLSFQIFMQKLPKSFESVSSIWAKNINESYAKTVENYLNLNAFPLPPSSNQINQWITRKTHGEFSKLLPINRELKNPRSSIGLSTLLLNTSWEPAYAFDKEKTEKQPFMGLTKEGSVNLMRRTGPVDYFENDKLQAIRMPLNDGLTITFILPKGREFQTFISGLTTEDIFDLPFVQQTIMVLLPQIQIRSAKDVVPSLKELGVEQVFDKENADLSGLSYEKNAFIGHIFHAIKFSLTEEAAAVSDNNDEIDCPTCTKEAQKQFRADRPFLFYISNGLIGGLYTDAP